MKHTPFHERYEPFIRFSVCGPAFRRQTWRTNRFHRTHAIQLRAIRRCSATFTCAAHLPFRASRRQLCGLHRRLRGGAVRGRRRRGPLCCVATFTARFLAVAGHFRAASPPSRRTPSASRFGSVRAASPSRRGSFRSGSDAVSRRRPHGVVRCEADRRRGSVPLCCVATFTARFLAVAVHFRAASRLRAGRRLHRVSVPLRLPSRQAPFAQHRRPSRRAPFAARPRRAAALRIAVTQLIALRSAPVRIALCGHRHVFLRCSSLSTSSGMGSFGAQLRLSRVNLLHSGACCVSSNAAVASRNCAAS